MACSTPPARFGSEQEAQVLLCGKSCGTRSTRGGNNGTEPNEIKPEARADFFSTRLTPQAQWIRLILRLT